MTYLKKEGMRAITPEFEHEYKAYREAMEQGDDAAVLEGVHSMDAETMQKALEAIGLNDNTKLAEVLGRSQRTASRIRNHPEELTLGNYKKLIAYADRVDWELWEQWKDFEQLNDETGGSYEDDVAEARSSYEGVAAFWQLLPDLVAKDYYRAARWELTARTMWEAFQVLTRRHRRILWALIRDMVERDCDDELARVDILNALVACTREQLASHAESLDGSCLTLLVMNRNIDEAEYAYDSSNIWGFKLAYEIGIYSSEADEFCTEPMGTWDDVQRAVLDEYTSPRERFAQE